MVAEAATEADLVGADTEVADDLGVEATGEVDVLAEVVATEVKFNLYIRYTVSYDNQGLQIPNCRFPDILSHFSGRKVKQIFIMSIKIALLN